MWAKLGEKSRFIFCNEAEKVLIPKMRGPPPLTPPHRGEGKRLAFRAINQIISLHTLPLWDHEGEGIFQPCFQSPDLDIQPQIQNRR